MTTKTDNGKDVSATGDEVARYQLLVEQMREQGYSPAETRQLLNDGWTEEQIREELLPPFDGDDGPPEKVEVEVDWGPSAAATREPEKPESMTDEQWESVPDVLKPASPVELEERLSDGARSWHFVAGDLRSRRVEFVIRNAMGCEEHDALEQHRLWGIPLVSDVVMVVYPTPEGVGLSFVSSADYEGAVFEGMSEVVPLDWIENRGRQSQWIPGLAERLADELGTGDVDALKSVLSRRAEAIPAALDSYGDDAVEFFSHPDTGGLVADTLSVDGVFSMEDESVEYRIKMRAPDELGIPGMTASLTLDGQAWARKSADAVKSAYMSTYGVELDLSDEMATMLYLEWDAMREMSTTVDLARETLVDGFVSALNGLSVTDAAAVDSSWEADAPAGILFEDDDGEDYIAVGSRWARSILGDEERELSRPFQEVLNDEGVVSEYGRASGVLYTALADAGVDNPRASVLVVPIGKTVQDAEEIRAVDDDDDELTVEL